MEANNTVTSRVAELARATLDSSQKHVGQFPSVVAEKQFAPDCVSRQGASPEPVREPRLTIALGFGGRMRPDSPTNFSHSKSKDSLTATSVGRPAHTASASSGRIPRPSASCCPKRLTISTSGRDLIAPLSRRAAFASASGSSEHPIPPQFLSTGEPLQRRMGGRASSNAFVRAAIRRSETRSV